MKQTIERHLVLDVNEDSHEAAFIKASDEAKTYQPADWKCDWVVATEEVQLLTE